MFFNSNNSIIINNGNGCVAEICSNADFYLTVLIEGRRDGNIRALLYDEFAFEHGATASMSKDVSDDSFTITRLTNNIYQINISIYKKEGKYYLYCNQPWGKIAVQYVGQGIGSLNIKPLNEPLSTEGMTLVKTVERNYYYLEDNYFPQFIDTGTIFYNRAKGKICFNRYGVKTSNSTTIFNWFYPEEEHVCAYSDKERVIFLGDILLETTFLKLSIKEDVEYACFDDYEIMFRHYYDSSKPSGFSDAIRIYCNNKSCKIPSTSVYNINNKLYLKVPKNSFLQSYSHISIIDIDLSEAIKENIVYTNGESKDRPIFYNRNIGFEFYDRTINKPIWWNGTAWVDENGNPADAKEQGTTEERPTNVQIGYIFKDTTLNKLIVWDGSTWINMDGTALT